MTVVSMTAGEGTHNEQLHQEMLKPPEQRDAARMERLVSDYAEQKAAEFKTACGCFGIEDVRILPFRDKPFVKCDEAVQAVREIIYELRPELLIAQSPYINTKGHFGRQGLATIQEDDHTECAITTLEAARLASLPDYRSRRIAARDRNDALPLGVLRARSGGLLGRHHRVEGAARCR